MDIPSEQFWVSAATIASALIALYSIIQARNLSLFNFRLKQFEIRPEIRVIEADILQKPNLEDAVGDERIVSGVNRYYYKINLKNTGNSEAVVEKVKMILEDGFLDTILTIPTPLAPGQEYIIPIYNVRIIKKHDSDVFARVSMLKIFYKDIFKNKIICEAKVGLVLAEPTPYLGVRTNIIHTFFYPEGFIPRIT